METLILDASRPEDIVRAAELLRNGQLVAIPTETVYGLAAPVFNEHSITEIFRVKGRPLDNPLIVHCAEINDVQSVAVNIPEIAWCLLERFAPGPLTLVLERHQSVPPIVSAGLPTVAVRIPAIAATRELISQVGQPLVAPSANRSGLPSPTSAEHVWEDLSGSIAAILDGGPCPIGIESTVLVLTETIAIARPGAISAEQIAQVLGFTPPLLEGTHVETPLAPGMKYRHYAPHCPVILISSLESIPPNNPDEIVVLTSQSCSTHYNVRPLYRQTLYDEFRRADKLKCKAIYVLVTEDVASDVALMNRLRKAAVSYINADDSSAE